MSHSPLRDAVSAASGNAATMAIGPQPASKTNLGDRIRSLISNLHPNESRGEQRRERRYPYPCLLRLSPYDESLMTSDLVGAPNEELNTDLMADGSTVVGHEISLNGIGFYHQEPIADRLVVVEFPAEPGSSPLRVVVDLTWCRFARKGWYESGGRLVRELGE